MKPALTLYYREGCHLCEDMQQTLEMYQHEMSFDLRRIDIDHDASLLDKYNVDVPVLAMDEVVICRHFLDMASLERVLSHV